MPPEFNQATIETPKNHTKIWFLIGLGTLLIFINGWMLYQNYFTEKAPVQNLTTADQIDEFSDWKTYRNEEYGFEFKYPGNLAVLDDASNVNLVSTIDQSKVKITISNFCEMPENIPKEDLANNFMQPYTPLSAKVDSLIKNYKIGNRNLSVFNQGCYECYDSWDSKTNKSYSDPEKSRDGYTAYSCNAGKNKNGNEAVLCLKIETERNEKGSVELAELQSLFFDSFIPNIKLYNGSMISECEGLGESRG